jgi:Ni,Fe-hydrogenase III large subunit
MTGAANAPSHSFYVASTVCADCHGSTIHQLAADTGVEPAINVSVSSLGERTQNLATELDAAENEIRTLRTMTIASLGFGLGIGGVLGIIFVSVVCKLAQRREEV